MNDRLYPVNHKGKEILYFDHRGLNGEGALLNVREAIQMMYDYKGQELLTLANFEGVYATKDIIAELKSEKSMAGQKKARKSAVVGIVGIKKIFLNAYNKLSGDKTRAFNTEEAAKDWLIQY